MPSDITGQRRLRAAQTGDVPLPSRAGVHEPPAGRRDQPHPAEDAGGAAGGDGGAPGHGRGRGPRRCPTRSWSSPRRTRSSTRAPTRCPRRSSTASCSSSRVGYPRPRRGARRAAHATTRASTRTTSPAWASTPVAGADDLREGARQVREIEVANEVIDYVLDLAAETRRAPSLVLGRQPSGGGDAARGGKGVGVAARARVRDAGRGEGGRQAGLAPPGRAAPRGRAGGRRRPTRWSTPSSSACPSPAERCTSDGGCRWRSCSVAAAALVAPGLPWLVLAVGMVACLPLVVLDVGLARPSGRPAAEPGGAERPAAAQAGHDDAVPPQPERGGALEVAVHDAALPSMGRTPRRDRATIEPGGWLELPAEIEPTRRGRFRLGPRRRSGRRAARARRPAGDAPGRAGRKVYPALKGRDEVALRLRRGRLLQAGVRSSAIRGGGSDLRRAARVPARRRVPPHQLACDRAIVAAITNQFREEKNQQLILLLDASRAMAGQVEGVPGSSTRSMRP